MELTITKQDLLRGLTRTHAVADRKSSMPILSNVLFSAEADGAVRFAATDLYLAVSASANAKVKKPGSVALAAKTLFDIVRSLPDGQVSLAVDKNHAVKLKCGKIQFRIPGMPGEDFPPLPSAAEVEMVRYSATDVARLVALTQFCMSSDDTRPHLAATLFEAEPERVRMVTTDGHRLSKAEVALGEDAHGQAFSMLVPSKGIGELKRLLEDLRSDKSKDEPPQISVGTTGGNAFFRTDDVVLSVKLADEAFPPYDKVIPKAHKRRVVMSRDLLTDALRRISLVASDKSGGVRLVLNDGKLQIHSENPDVGEGTEELDVDYAGEELSVGFNARYLLDVLGALQEDEVAFELGGELDPGVLKPLGETDYVGVIMPMRI